MNPTLSPNEIVVLYSSDTELFAYAEEQANMKDWPEELRYNDTDWVKDVIYFLPSKMVGNFVQACRYVVKEP